MGIEPGRKAYRFLETIEQVDLIANDAPYLQPKAVRTQINGSDQIIGHKIPQGHTIKRAILHARLFGDPEKQFVSARIDFA